MEKLNAIITGIASHVPEYILTNEELSTMVDTTDEWIRTRIGTKNRHMLKGEGLGASDIAVPAVKQLLEKKNLNPDEIQVVICSTATPDYRFPSTASIIAEKCGIKHSFAFDIQAACSGFLYAMEIANGFIKSGLYKKVLVVSAEYMTSIIDYTDRAICPIFGDGATAVLVEPTTEDLGIMDTELHTDGVGFQYLMLKSGGSVSPITHETLDRKEQYLHQEGRTVFKYAVTCMSDVSE